MNLIWLIVAVLVAVWVVGFFMDVIGGIIHLILIVAVAFAIYGFLKRKMRRR